MIVIEMLLVKIIKYVLVKKIYIGLREIKKSQYKLNFQLVEISLSGTKPKALT